MSALALLLVTFPLAVALAQMPWLVGGVVIGYLLLAKQFKCLKAFSIILGVAFLYALLVYTGSVIHADIDNYLGPQVRAFLLPEGTTLDGAYKATHMTLPQGFAAYGAALYRLTGSVDLASSAFVLFLCAAWGVLRAHLSKLQTLLLLVCPASFASLFSLMPDGCVYLLLLIALFSLKARNFWLTLLPATLACTFKTTAWIPTALLAVALFLHFPRRWWQIAGVGLLTLLTVFPTLHLIWGGGLTEISDDFLTRANADAQQMGYFARLAYVYLGHWTTSLSPDFGIHPGGVDGGGVDGYGPLFRLMIAASLLTLLLCRKRLNGWKETLILVWLSVLLMPTTYIGYARYVPWLYVAGALPLILFVPRTTCVPAALLLVIPLGWLGWRLVLSTETVYVANRAETVQSHVYNIRATFREKLVEEPQPAASGSLLYTYRLPEGDSYPVMTRAYHKGLDLEPRESKAREGAQYILKRWLPWALHHPHTLFYEIVRFRAHALLHFPRGGNDGLPTP